MEVFKYLMRWKQEGDEEGTNERLECVGVHRASVKWLKKTHAMNETCPEYHAP